MVKKVTALYLSCCAGLLVVVAQSAGPAASSKALEGIILDVPATQYAIGLDWDYAYVRVFSDGHAEAQTFTLKSPFEKPQLTTVTTTLSRERFAAVEHLLDDSEVMDLDSRYPQRISKVVLDFFTVWHIRLRHRGSEQQLEVVEFAPVAAKQRGQPYPNALVKLGCVIAMTRAETIGEEFRQPECHLTESSANTESRPKK